MCLKSLNERRRENMLVSIVSVIGSTPKLIPKKFRPAKVRINQPESLKEPEALQQEFSGFKFESAEGKSFFVEKILTDSTISLAERLQCRADKNARPRVILSWNAGHDQSNLGGCPDWNCELTLDRSKFKEAGAVPNWARIHERLTGRLRGRSAKFTAVIGVTAIRERPVG
ncbi:unnamed protein product [Nippostrongylus brasiliensis]|uniref:Oxidored_molyb domain-containing protein n=1 Tax=Nippostrongylus brasiliensis TaxID=27835 RepID=A0A0N4YE58_NIPBR|nr:unnamed protein product [Nippostrongylus brasiliensis]